MTEQVAIKRGPGRPPTSTMAGRKEPEPQPCPECFPEGWKGIGKKTYSVGCPHGTYVQG